MSAGSYDYGGYHKWHDSNVHNGRHKRKVSHTS